MLDTNQVLQLSPAKVARLMRVARKIHSQTAGVYSADTVLETLVSVECNRNHQRRDDADNMRRASFR